MINNYSEYLILEKLGVNNDIKSISEYIFNLIKKNDKETTYIINSDDIELEKIILDKIILKIKKENENISGYFNIQKSDITEKGLYAIINFHGAPDIHTIYHELNHALQFYYIGKTQSLKQLSNLKSFNTKSNNEVIKEFLYLLYISENSELDSFISESYKKLKNILLSIKEINKDKFNITILFKEFYKDTPSYNHYELLKNYNIDKKFEPFKKEDIVSFIDYIENKNRFYKKYYKKNLFNIIRLIFKELKDYKDYKFNNIELIKDIDNKYNNIIKKYNKRFKDSSIKIHKKLIRLYSILEEEI